MKKNITSVLSVKSVTYALKGQRILEANYISARIVRPSGNSGCAYGLEIDRRDLQRAKNLMERGGVPFRVL